MMIYNYFTTYSPRLFNHCQVQQVVSYIDVSQPDLSSLYQYQIPSVFTDHVHNGNERLPNELITREQKSEAIKRTKLQVVKALIDKYQMSRVMVGNC